MKRRLHAGADASCQRATRAERPARFLGTLTVWGLTATQSDARKKGDSGTNKSTLCLAGNVVLLGGNGAHRVSGGTSNDPLDGATKALGAFRKEGMADGNGPLLA